MSNVTACVAVVGAGLIGRAWAISFARAGCTVRLFDPDPSALVATREAVGEALADLARHDLLRGQSPAEVLARIDGRSELAAALEGAIHVQECAPEDLHLKRRLFAELTGAAAAEAVIASSTSAFMPSVFTAEAAGRERCLVAHPINPPYLVPLVQIVPAPWTDPGVVERTERLMRSVGQVPIRLAVESDGFVVNRLQGALIHEAMRLVEEGVASAGDIDRAIAFGLGLRWSFMGPFETMELNAPGGIRDYVERYGTMYRRIIGVAEDETPWDGVTLERIERDRRLVLSLEELPRRQLWRDRQLMRVAAGKAGRADEAAEA